MIDPSFDKYDSLNIDKIPQNKIKISGNKLTGQTSLISPIDLKGKQFAFVFQLKHIKKGYYGNAKVADFSMSIDDYDIFKLSDLPKSIYLEEFLKYSKWRCQHDAHFVQHLQ